MAEEDIALGFSSWLTPGDALEILNELGSDVAAREIYRRLKVGFIRAAGEASWREGSKDEYRYGLRVQKEWWEGVDFITAAYSDFWKIGGLTFKIVRSATHYTRIYEFFDIRFEPDGIYLIPGAAAPPPGSPLAGQQTEPTTPLTKRGGRLSDSEMDKFSHIFLGVHGESGTEEQVVRAVRAIFPEHDIPRDHFLSIFREIRGPKKRGRPRGSGK